jgi:hypothetical protein
VDGVWIKREGGEVFQTNDDMRLMAAASSMNRGFSTTTDGPPGVLTRVLMQSINIGQRVPQGTISCCAQVIPDDSANSCIFLALIEDARQAW